MTTDVPRPFHVSPSLMDRGSGGLATVPDPGGDAGMGARIQILRLENRRLVRELGSLKEVQADLVGRVEDLNADNERVLLLLAESRGREQDLRARLQEREERLQALLLEAGARAERLAGELEEARQGPRRRPARTLGRPPLERLQARLEKRLGRTGPMLLGRILQREGLGMDCRKPAHVLRVVERLEDLAPCLVSGDGGKVLAEDLASLRRRLVARLGARSTRQGLVSALPEALVTPEVVPVEPVAPVEAAAQTAVLAEPTPEPVAPVEAAVEPVAAVEAALETAAVAEPEPAPERMSSRETPPESGALEPQAPEVGASTLSPARDPELLQDLQTARWRLADGQAEEALDLLLVLDRRFPDCLEVQSALFDLFVQFECWPEAHGVATRLGPALTSPRERERFRGCMARVLEKRVDSTRDPVEKKGYLLELAELHLDVPEAAVAWLQRARLQPERHPRDGWIDLHLTRLGVGGPEERCRTLFRWMNRMAEHAEVFDHLEGLSGTMRFRDRAPVARAVVALVREGRQRGAEIEAGRDYRRALPSPGRPERLLQEFNDVRETLVLRRVLDEILYESGQTLPDLPAADRSLLQASLPVSRTWGPAKVAEELRHAMFGGPLQVLRSEGGEGFLVRALSSDVPTLLIQADAEALPAEDLRPLLAGALYRLRRRHADLRRLNEGMDDRLRAALIRGARARLLQSGGALPDELDRRVEALAEFQPSTLALFDLCGRCLRASRSDGFAVLDQLFREERPFAGELDRAADQFVALAFGPTAASVAVARELLGQGELLDRCLAQGFGILYGLEQPPVPELRLRLQRTWLGPLRAAFSR